MTTPPDHVHAFAYPADDAVDIAAETFRMLGDPTRIRIVLRLLEAGELSVNALADAVGRTPSAISQHLAKLRLARLVATRRDGTTVHYRIDNVHLRQLVEDALFHTDHVERGLGDHPPTR
ncbi:MAG TPA: metalloregulator ArsR/SmtB family transcription factor [Euzebyales bacterium]